MFETTPHDRVGANRAGRIVFGSVLIAGAVGLVSNLRAQAMLHDGFGIGANLRTHEMVRDVLGSGVSSLAIVVGSWVLAFLIGGLVSNARIADGRGLRTASLVIPSVGVALMLPLLLHVPFLIGGGTKAFDDWAALAVVAVGVAHIVGAILMGVRAYRLARGKTPPSVGAVYGFSVLAACVPWGMFVLPELLVAITGLAFLPILYAQATLANKDRADERLDEIPHAIAHFRALI